MDASKFIQTVAQFAPLVGRILPLPGGAIIGDLIAHEFGGSTSNYDDLISKIQADPDAAMKLKQFELTHKENLQQIALQSQIAENQDRQNARQRQIELAKSGHTDWVLPGLSILITIGFFISIACVMATKADASDHDILNMMLGVLGTAWIQVISYYFGSSHKESKIAQMANHLYQAHLTLVKGVAGKKQDDDFEEQQDAA